MHEHNPDHFRFPRTSGLPRDYFKVRPALDERVGGYVLAVVMTGVAAFIAAGLACGVVRMTARFLLVFLSTVLVLVLLNL